MQSRYKAMVFDMDGTLLDSMFYWRTMWREYVEEHGLLMPEELKDKVIYGCGKACDLIARDNNLDRPALYTAMLEEMLARHYRTDVTPKPFVGDALKKLRAEGYPLVVATATPRHLAEPALARHGLLECVDFVTDVVEMGAQKNTPDFFLNVAKRLDLAPNECVMFEDAVYAIRSAKAAGMTVCAIDEPISYPDKEEITALADRYIASWREIAEEEAFTI
ncbi:MAG: HAD family phosphatase [Clostridia bacterium]|nr:HAD family phosphatase [Clostridia bacterium]